MRWRPVVYPDDGAQGALRVGLSDVGGTGVRLESLAAILLDRPVQAGAARPGKVLERSVREARRLAAIARRKARGGGAAAKRKAAANLEELADRCEKVARQIRQRVAGEPIKHRTVSRHDRDARPIRKGKLGKKTEFGFVSQLAEIYCRSRPSGQPAEETLLPAWSPSPTGSGSRSARSPRTAGSSPDRRTLRSRTFTQRRCASLAARKRPPSAPPAGCGATAAARRAGSATSNAAAVWGAPA